METDPGGWQAINGRDGQAVATWKDMDGCNSKGGAMKELGGQESGGGVWRPGHEAKQPGAHSHRTREPIMVPGKGSSRI